MHFINTPQHKKIAKPAENGYNSVVDCPPQVLNARKRIVGYEVNARHALSKCK